MSKEEQNKAVVGRWFSEFWGKKKGADLLEEHGDHVYRRTLRPFVVL